MQHEERESRKKATLKQELAAAIAQLFDLPHEHVEQMTVDQIRSLVEVDHYPVPFSTARDLGWTPEQYNHPSNLRIRLRGEHRQKTREEDQPQIAKSKRISDEHEAFRQRLLAKGEPEPEPSPWTTKPKAKIQSRGFPKRPDGTKFNWRRGGRLEKKDSTG